MNDRSLKERWTRSRLNRVSLKIAGVVGMGAVVLSMGLLQLPWWGDGASGVLMGSLAFGAAYWWLGRRFKLAYATLRKIRHHEFEDLEAASVPRGDELNTLIWQIYRTGQMLEREIRELKQMESYRREFIGNVSHELKTPIFSVQGFAETLLDGALEDESVNRTFVEKILQNVNRLDNLARDLSAISRIEMGQLEMEMKPFDLGDLIDEVADSLAMKAEEKGVDLRYQLPDACPPVQGDRERIRQVIVNLVDNAIKYNQSGGRVDIVAEPDNGNVRVAVIDDGIGISDEHINRLTERFYRVDKSRSRNQGGTGLGLAIVKHILGAHDRTLQVESTPGEGSRFWFTLPAAER